ncbi:hypothetical protein AAE478_002623 [Parahypoxylon ruwenzoriense]
MKFLTATPSIPASSAAAAVATIATFLAGLVTVAAAPAAVEQRQTYAPCSGLYGTAQCCATDVLGLADLDCANPPETPTSTSNFTDICAGVGQRARCCVLPLLGQGLLCADSTGA